MLLCHMMEEAEEAEKTLVKLFKIEADGWWWGLSSVSGFEWWVFFFLLVKVWVWHTCGVYAQHSDRRHTTQSWFNRILHCRGHNYTRSHLEVVWLTLWSDLSRCKCNLYSLATFFGKHSIQHFKRSPNFLPSCWLQLPVRELQTDPFFAREKEK